MGVIDSLLGRGDGGDDTCKIPSEHDGVTYTVSRESHDVAYAVVVREADLAALDALVRADRETPYVEGGDDEALAAAIEDAFDDDVDVEAWRERLERPRRTVAAVLETWRDLVADEVGVGYLPIGAHEALAAFVRTCRDRAADEDDPFSLPDEAAAVADLVSRVGSASERPENRVVVNRTHLPDLEGRVDDEDGGNGGGESEDSDDESGENDDSTE